MIFFTTCQKLKTNAIKKINVVLFFCLACTLSHAQERDTVLYQYEGAPPEKGKIDKNGERTGLWKIYSEIGQLSEEGKYRSGKKTGEWKHYYENGQLWGTEHYVNGEDSGEVKMYFENGQLHETGNSVRHRKTGEWKVYHENGKLYETGIYRNDTTIGEWKAYHENGKLNRLSFFTNEGYPTGEWKSYDVQGKLVYVGIQDKNFSDEKKYYNTGQLRETGRYEREPGKETKAQEGEWRKYHPNGQVQEIGKYHLGQKTGEWKYFDEKGNLIKTETFD